MSQTDQEPKSEDVDGVLSLFDEIVDNAADDLAVLAKVTILRERLAGSSPSIIVRKLIVVSDEGEIVRVLRSENAELEARLEALSASVEAKPENGHYTLAQFHARLHQKMGRTYGWRVDYIESTKTTPDCRIVKTEEIQRWQQTQQVPDWAYDQIDKLIFNKRKGENGPAWSNIEFDFLVALYEGTAVDGKGEKIASNSGTSNLVFSKHCTEKFGRDITENAIKGAIDRLRKKDRLPKRRNAKAA